MEMNNTLFLPLKKEWYELIEKGIKPEDYRYINEYWIKRLIETDFFYELPTKEELIEMEEDGELEDFFKHFEAVKFSYGYTKRAMTFECKGIDFGTGNPEWGAKPGEVYFIIKLGRRLK